MATITTKLSLTGSGLTSNQLSLNLNDLLTVTTPHLGLSKISAPHNSATVIIASSISAATYVYLRNTDTTNYIALKNDAGNGWGKLHPGESIMFAVYPSVGFEIQAAVASCVVEYGYWTKA